MTVHFQIADAQEVLIKVQAEIERLERIEARRRPRLDSPRKDCPHAWERPNTRRGRA